MGPDRHRFITGGTDTRNSTRRGEFASAGADEPIAEIPKIQYRPHSRIGEGLGLRCVMKFRRELGGCVSLLRDLRLAFCPRFSKPVITLSYRKGCIKGLLTARRSTGYGSFNGPRFCSSTASGVSALLVFGGLRYWLVGFPHVRPLV